MEYPWDPMKRHIFVAYIKYSSLQPHSGHSTCVVILLSALFYKLLKNWLTCVIPLNVRRSKRDISYSPYAVKYLLLQTEAHTSLVILDGTLNLLCCPLARSRKLTLMINLFCTAQITILSLNCLRVNYIKTSNAIIAGLELKTFNLS